jgi:membrane protein implicated in regulation of membrane protease activity
VVERFLNGLNFLDGIRGAILFGVIAVAAIIAGGWQGWLIGLVFLVLAVYALVAPWKWPKYRPPET